MNFSQFQQTIGHRGCTHRDPGEARNHRGEIVSPVEAVFEFGKVPWDALGIDGVVCSGDCGPDVSQRGVDPFKGLRSRRRGSGARDHDLMRTNGIGDTAEAPQSSLTTTQLGCRLVFAKPAIEWPQKLPTRRSFGEPAFPRAWFRRQRRTVSCQAPHVCACRRCVGRRDRHRRSRPARLAVWLRRVRA